MIYNNSVIFNESRKFIIPIVDLSFETPNIDENRILIASANANLQALGFSMSKEMMNELAGETKETIINAYKELYGHCAEAIGQKQLSKANVFYPNFPDQVMNMSDFELYMNAAFHYFGEYLFGEDLAYHGEKVDRHPLIESFNRELKIINMATPKDYDDMMKARITSIKSLPAHKMYELQLYFELNPEKVSLLAKNTIPNKENLVNLAFWFYKWSQVSTYGTTESTKVLKTMLKDSVDVLRFAAVLSNGKTTTQGKRIANSSSLNGYVNFNLTKEEGRLIKNLLNNCPNLYSDIWLQKDLFKSLAKFGVSMRNDTPKRVKKAFDNLHSNKKLNENGTPLKTFNRQLNEAIEKTAEKQFADLEKIASANPGLFARNFVRALEAVASVEDKLKIVGIYEKAATSLPYSERLKINNYLQKVSDFDKNVYHSPKNGKYKIKSADREIKDEVRVATAIATMKSFKNTLENAAPLGLTYIDPELRNNKLPENNMRDSSKGSVLTPFSTIPATKEANIKRLFLWWTNDEGNSRIDIDTGIVFFNKDHKRVGDCSFRNLKTKDEINTVYAVHSGDWINGGDVNGDGVAEFADIDTKLAKEAGVKYAMFTVSSFSGQPFVTLPNIKFGFMEREGQLEEFDRLNMRGSSLGNAADWSRFNGEIYEPSTVNACIDLNTNSTQSMVVIFDLENDRFVWLDKSLTTERAGLDNYNSHLASAIEAVLHEIEQDYRPNMQQLFYMHVHGRDANTALTNDITEAQTVFVSKPIDAIEHNLKEDAKVITAYDLSIIQDVFMNHNKVSLEQELEVLPTVPTEKQKTKEDKDFDSYGLELDEI